MHLINSSSLLISFPFSLTKWKFPLSVFFSYSSLKLTSLDFAKFSRTFSGTPTFGPFISAGKILILSGNSEICATILVGVE